MNSGCATNVFKLAFRFLVFPKIPEILETLAHKKSNLQHYRKIKMLWIVVFWSDCETEAPQNIILGLNRKMPQYSKIIQKNSEFKMQWKFNVAKNSCLAILYNLNVHLEKSSILPWDRVKGYINCCFPYSFVFLKYWQDRDDYWAVPN